MTIIPPKYAFSPLSPIFNALYRESEQTLIPKLIDSITLSDPQKLTIRHRATKLIEGVRQQKMKAVSVENFLQTYDLSSKEGISLMCLAEALLRIPDKVTQTALIRDKISAVNWLTHLGKAGSLAMNVATLGLATTELFLTWGLEKNSLIKGIADLSRKMTEPTIRQAVAHAMRILGCQFVMGETIEEALKRAQANEARGYRHSYDMLGEGAKTAADAARYFEAYRQGIESVANYRNTGDIFAQPSISVKLSALHPRYELAMKDRAFDELLPQVVELCRAAKAKDIALTIDAEESERLELSLELLKVIAADPSLKDWDGLGLAVQAYQKRSSAVIDWLNETASATNRRFCVRLVKGAYWDSEIKKTQERGLEDYPVFTRKIFTDISYLSCTQKMLNNPCQIYPQFATHNAYTVATILEIAAGREFEFQRLHGMGEQLYDQFVDTNTPCRIYAPVGEHRDLLAYLVRRLLENGANSSFVNKIYTSSVAITSLIQDPIGEAKNLKTMQHPHIPSPKEMLMPTRLNSKGFDLNDQDQLQNLQTHLTKFKDHFPLYAGPLLGENAKKDRQTIEIRDPANPTDVVGLCDQCDTADVQKALDVAAKNAESWSQVPVESRAQTLEKLAANLESHYGELIGLLVYESGKTVADAVAEIREAVDFCRYYANQARLHMAAISLPGPTGEKNELTLHSRGVFVCISPWNFPLAIFLGQVAAALVTGNAVLAKPAQQTPYVAYRTCQLAFESGIPEGVLQFLPAKGSDIGKHMLTDPRVSGVAFTGSTEVAWTINQTLSARRCAIAPLIAETGGINAMIVDSSALSEQVVSDIITSSFQSAGQRCSALRLLFIQEDIADKTLEMLAGAMQQLNLTHPANLNADVGAVIDAAAQKELLSHIDTLKETGRLIASVPLDESTHGYFVAPQAWELPNAAALTREVFGPILHIVRFKADELNSVINQINAKGFGLTLSLHSRIDATIQKVRKHAKVGNFYVNRNMIGAVVGVQPFGGEGLSGTGPKAGGPHYLLRFTVERTFTQDTTAAGGNASLLATLS
ncbi:bifunctional proline dehydrogenase/L-glutamate gamma-semialdehyde dehydrogenase PutA [Candidatus Paracaedibacter symbiosus]|uniref:bifunctional proline dehydrogenase/L-glutamate gamma-semialdehyde dehydrogenase PutA n=1 Tax=Candidatus Paracaedibacter symbiosus TaxID=244582 RepID=UPI000689F19B|nr:bifunctional proline dehydrogenase/L-glutamate gamma-semialdehyde dehydrogenase PutA [Candidatus Paracaedibacter symbiosus]